MRIDAETKNLLESLTERVSSQFCYSRSGHYYTLIREKLGGYDRINEKKYGELRSLIHDSFFFKAFNLMLHEKMADCFEQSFLLALLLRCIPKIGSVFQIFLVSVNPEQCKNQHTFIVLIPPQSMAENALDFFKKENGYFSGEALFNKPIIFLDSWRNKVFWDVAASSHPLDFLPSLCFARTDFLFQNFNSYVNAHPELVLNCMSSRPTEKDLTAIYFIRKILAECKQPVYTENSSLRLFSTPKLEAKSEQINNNRCACTLL